MNSQSLLKKILGLIIAGLIMISLMSLVILLAGIALSDIDNGSGSSSSNKFNQPSAKVYDQSKANAAGSINTSGWDETWVDQFNIDAADPPYVTGEYIDNFLKNYYPNSPMIGKGTTIKRFSDYYGVSIGTFIGQIAKETQYASVSCGGRWNAGCIRWYEGAKYPAMDTLYGKFQDYPDLDTGIEAFFHLIRTNYIATGQVKYKDYLNKYSPTSENNQATFKNIFYGALRAFGYDSSDTERKTSHMASSEIVDGKIDGSISDSVSSGQVTTGNIDLKQTRLSAGVLKWQDAISQEMSRQGVPQEYLPYLLGIVANESGGGGVRDIFQASESKGLAVNALSSEKASIEAGVAHFKNALTKAEAYGLDIWSVCAGYNFGHAFLDYLHQNNLRWSIKVAETYSRTVVAPSLGNTSGEKMSYVNQVSQLYGINYYYRNGGNFHYVPMLMYHLGFSNEQIKTLALNGSSGAIMTTGGMTREEVLTGEYTYFGDSLVAGTQSEFLKYFSNSNAFGTISLQMEAPYTPELDGTRKLKELINAGKVKKNLIVQLGTNGSFSQYTLDKFIETAGDRKIYFITTASNVSHAQEVVNALKTGESRHENIKVIDWYAYAKDKNVEYYGTDHIHFNQKGSEALIDFIINYLMKEGQTSTNSSNSRILFGKLKTKKSGSSLGTNGDIVEIAEGMLGWFYYLQAHPSPDLGSDLKNPNKNGGTDCSGFVWLVLNKAGYQVPPNMGWYTGSMSSDARGEQKYLVEIQPNEAKAGDIVIINVGSGAGNDGHTAILIEDYHGGETQIIQVGGIGEGANHGTIANSFGGSLTGGDFCFARAIKTAKED